MGQPLLLGVDSDRDILAAIQRDLTRRFAADYRIVTAETPEGASAELDAADHTTSPSPRGANGSKTPA